MFLTAATELGVAPHAAMVIEDAAAGVEAAKAGDMVPGSPLLPGPAALVVAAS
jgi:hypothetical protein